MYGKYQLKRQAIITSWHYRKKTDTLDTLKEKTNNSMAFLINIVDIREKNMAEIFRLEKKRYSNWDTKETETSRNNRKFFFFLISNCKKFNFDKK